VVPLLVGVRGTDAVPVWWPFDYQSGFFGIREVIIDVDNLNICGFK
jgi:hypothetical protein